MAIITDMPAHKNTYLSDIKIFQRSLAIIYYGELIFSQNIFLHRHRHLDVQVVKLFSSVGIKTH